MQIAKDFWDHMKLLLVFIAVLWGVHILSIILTKMNIIEIQQFGLQPRRLVGLIGIVTSHFLHGGIFHLLANTVALLTIGVIFTALKGKSTFVLMVEIAVLQGILLWLFGRSAIHIGASGLIFGLFGYLLLIGYFQRKIPYMILSLFILLSYGSMLFGLLPVNPFISWEGHLFGFIVGGIEAKLKA